MEKALSSGQPRSIDFAQTGDFFSLLREVAEEDYARHLLAAQEAKSPEDKLSAIAALERATHASVDLSKAQEYFLHSRDSFKSATVQMLRGDEKAAELQSERSSQLMRAAAERVQIYSDYGQQSRMWNAAVEIVGRRDELGAAIGRKAEEFKNGAHAQMTRTGESLSRGIRAFGAAMHEFADRIQKMPKKIHEYAHEKSISLYMATAAIAGTFMSKLASMRTKSVKAIEERIEPVLKTVEDYGDAVRQTSKATVEATMDVKDMAVLAGKHAIDRTVEKAQMYGAQARAATWELLDELSNNAKAAMNATKSTAIAAGNGMERHARATIGTIGHAAGVLRQLGAQVAEVYGGEVEKAADVQTRRRPKP